MIAFIKKMLGFTEAKPHSGKCDLCDEPFLMWLDGSGLYCWKHYAETQQAPRWSKKTLYGADGQPHEVLAATVGGVTCYSTTK